MWQMRVPARTRVQVWHGHSQGEGAFVWAPSEADAWEGQNQTVGAPKLLPQASAGLSEQEQHQRGGRRGGEGRLQGDAQGEYGAFRVRVLVREVGHVSVFYQNGKKMQKREGVRRLRFLTGVRLWLRVSLWGSSSHAFPALLPVVPG